MTIEEALDFIRKNSQPGDWYLNSYGLIRSTKKEQNSLYTKCPVCWLASAMEVNPDNLLLAFDTLLFDLGLSQEDADAIARAADNHHQAPPELRQKLLEACHLAA